MWRFLFDFFVSFIGFIGSLVALAQFFLGTKSYSELVARYSSRYNVPTDIAQILGVIFTLRGLAIIGVIVLIVKWIAYYRKHKKAKNIAEHLHRFQHEMRNRLFEAKLETIKNRPSNHVEFYSRISLMCKELCDIINDFLKEKTGKNFSICIKLLQNYDLESTGSCELCTYTLCRAGKDAHQRTEHAVRRYASSHRVVNEHDLFFPISKNSALMCLLGETAYGNKTDFSCSNLWMLKIINKILKRPPYLNSNRDYHKFYKSTVVVPIRIKSGYFANNEFGNIDFNSSDYITAGFLCLDYRFSMSGALRDELAVYMKSFADSFFALFVEIKSRDEQIAQNEVCSV